MSTKMPQFVMDDSGGRGGRRMYGFGGWDQMIHGEAMDDFMAYLCFFFKKWGSEMLHKGVGPNQRSGRRKRMTKTAQVSAAGRVKAPRDAAVSSALFHPLPRAAACRSTPWPQAGLTDHYREAECTRMPCKLTIDASIIN